MSPFVLGFLLLQDAEPGANPEPPPPPPPPPAPVQPEPPPPTEPAMSEGRMLVSASNSGFQWGISPGIVWVKGDAGFALGLHFGYGFDTGPVILVPGLRLSAFFTDPSVYVGMPDFKLVIPIDRFAPFVEAGIGAGYVSNPSKVGVALEGGGGFVVYFRHVALGAEVSYQTITGTSFHGVGVGPILSFAF